MSASPFAHPGIVWTVLPCKSWGLCDFNVGNLARSCASLVQGDEHFNRLRMPGRAFDTGKPSSIGISHLVSKHHHQNHNLIFKGACSCLVAITTFHRSCCLCTKRSCNLPPHGVLQCEPVRARSYQSGPFAVSKQHTEIPPKKSQQKRCYQLMMGTIGNLTKSFSWTSPGYLNLLDSKQGLRMKLLYFSSF